MSDDEKKPAAKGSESAPEENGGGGGGGRRNDLIIADGFPALSTFKPPTGKSTGDDDFSATKDDPIPRYPFASFPRSLQVKHAARCDFLGDCERAFTARAKETGEAYSAGATFFVPAKMTPRCALEGLALDIFKAHTKGLKEGVHYDPDRSGAEWWTLVLEVSDKEGADKEGAVAASPKNPISPPPVAAAAAAAAAVAAATSTTAGGKSAAAKKGKGNDESDDEDDDDEDDEVGMHFDADYGLEAQLPNYMLHPRVATITYLSDIGVPTLILDKVSPPPSDVSKSSLAGDISTGWLSHPDFGKHIAFDGRMLHGAPGTFFPAVEEEREEKSPIKKMKLNDGTPALGQPAPGRRVTFLVNIWLNHCPIDADLLDAEDAYAMRVPFKESDWRNEMGLVGTRPIEFNILDVDAPDKVPCVDFTLPTDKGEEAAGTDECVLCNHEVDMVFGASMSMAHTTSAIASSTPGRSAQIKFQPGSLSLVVGKEVEDSDDDDDNSK